MDRKTKYYIFSIMVVLILSIPLAGIIPRMEGIHTLFLNDNYLSVRNESVQNGTSQRVSTIELYFPANVSISGFGHFELALIPAFYWDPLNYTLNASLSGPVPSTYVNLLFLSANYTSTGNLGFSVTKIGISSPNFSIPEITGPYLVRYTEQGGFGQSKFIGPDYLIGASAPSFPKLNISMVPNGVYFLHLTIALYKIYLGLPVFEGSFALSMPYMTVVR